MRRQPKIRNWGKMSLGDGFTYLDCRVSERFRTGSGSYRSLEALRRRL
jgi:hypothetical protein